MTRGLLVWSVALASTLYGLTALAGERLVFGSFARADNASSFARLLSQKLDAPVSVEPAPNQALTDRTDGNTAAPMYRVVSRIFPEPSAAIPGSTASQRLLARATAQGYQPWFWRGLSEAAPRPAPERADAIPAMPATRTGPGAIAQLSPRQSITTRTEFDLGLQTRSYAQAGQHDQSRWQLSASGQFDWFRSWGGDRHALTVTPFFRLDSEDDERTHFDLREGFYSYIGDRFEWHLGARQVFWGVTEFKHLVDIVNQTDLVENIDGEDKLGQGMVQLSLSRDWGVLDLYLLAGNRERTFPGEQGRLRFGLPVAVDDARFESSAGRQRLDGAIRWSHYAGPLSWGLHHFSGTSRDPLLLLSTPTGTTDFELVPYYQVIDQTGVDAQLLLGDWAWKLEAITRSGDGDRYGAANLGVERTLVGVFGSRADLGVVLEYLFDERGDDAHNTLFERDLAVGARWAFNDAADSQALLGVIWDTRTDEYVVSLEASRQLGQDWQLLIEGRAFAGAPTLDGAAQLAAFVDGSAKSAFLQRDDFLQLELRRFF
ncbi:MAG: hypothetical protein AB8B93_16190 [Pseudomonadales bacterium]